VTVYSASLTRLRVIDLETTGTTAGDAVVEIAAVDLVGGQISWDRTWSGPRF
jgi:exodeoxyribonuclease X